MRGALAEPRTDFAKRGAMKITPLDTFWTHGGAHVLAVRQYNWLTSDVPVAAEATVILRMS